MSLGQDVDPVILCLILMAIVCAAGFIGWAAYHALLFAVRHLQPLFV